MRDLFDQLKAGNEADILNLVTSQMQETVTLDFKQKADPETGAFDKSDKKTLAAAISGFANSGGGLLIWGVDARKGVDQIDCAQNAVPISEIKRFFSEATTLAGQLVQPKHDGVEFAVVDSANKLGGGYLLMYVERSERRPHRSEAQDQKQYFKRAGDGFFPMEHYDIEDAFQRRPNPKLELVFLPEAPQNDGEIYYVNRTLGLKNDSEHIAKYPYLTIFNMFDFEVHPRGLTGKGDQGLRQVRLQRSFQYLGGADDVIHPGSILQVAKFRTVCIFRHGSWFCSRGAAETTMASFGFTIGCEGMRALTDRREFLAVKGYWPPR